MFSELFSCRTANGRLLLLNYARLRNASSTCWYMTGDHGVHDALGRSWSRCCCRYGSVLVVGTAHAPKVCRNALKSSASFIYACRSPSKLFSPTENTEESS